MSEAPNYSNTLNLPKTDFPMKASLAQREPQRFARWKEQGVYRKAEAARAGARRFVLHDGPPYANGDLHIGHTLNKVLKDIIVKYKRLQGYSAPYVPGWDCHGLPIELKSIEDSGQGTPAEIRARCRAYAHKWVERQREQFERLGILGDWEAPYLTLNAEFEAETLRALADLQQRGYVRRGDKPVHWCTSCQTALAEAEVEYADHRSSSLYVRFPLADGSASLIIWTTTPWTLPANLAVAVSAEAEYGYYSSEYGTVIMAADLAGAVFKARGLDAPAATRIVKGESLVGLEYRHPFLDRAGQVHSADFVELSTGTGMVHIAPGHGEDDYRLGRAVGLEPYAPVNGKGQFVNVADWLDGIHVFKGNKLVLAKLADLGLSWSASELQHAYPHCWRCQNPIIFRATPQWFVSMQAGDLRQKCLAEIERVNWVPQWGHERIRAMMENRPDWCISRQRVWGVPFAGLACHSCGHEWLDPGFMRTCADAFGRDTSDIWFSPDRRAELLQQAPACPQCGGRELKGADDILDVWFDSGISWRAFGALDNRVGEHIDMYLEGSDQHRGWFQSSLLLSVSLQGRAPYDTVLTHGFVVDGNGYKMSKSRGNVVVPSKIWNDSGAEILRVWCASEDYSMDVRVSDAILKQNSEAYRRVRNTLRFLLGNLGDFDPIRDSVPYDQLCTVDRVALHQLAEKINTVTASYESFQFHAAFQAIQNYCVQELGGFYLDLIKDRAYCHGVASPRRRGAQTVMHAVLEALVSMVAPILSFTADECFEFMPWRRDQIVFAQQWPVAPAHWEMDADELDRLNAILVLRKQIQAVLEPIRQAKIIGQPLDAAVAVTGPRSLWQAMAELGDDARKLCIVSHITFAEGAELQITARHADGAKCARCWHYEMELDAGELCQRCSSVIAGQGVV